MSEQTAVITALSDAECWEMLRAHEFGRLAFHLAGEVHITPINYTTDGERLFFRTAEGSKLLGVAMNSDIAFEIDEITDETATSVVMRGRATVLEGEDQYVVDTLPLRPWVPTLKFNIIAISVDELSGRSFQLERPWRHIAPVQDD